MRPVQHGQMSWHQFVKSQAAKQREDNRAEKTLPGFFPTDVGHHQMPSNYTPRQICAHVRELGDRDQVQHIELPGELSAARTRSEIHNLGDEIEKPKHIEQTEQRVSHSLQGLVVPQPRKHLSPEYRQQKEKQN